jgi:hypothetical protein
MYQPTNKKLSKYMTRNGWKQNREAACNLRVGNVREEAVLILIAGEGQELNP